MVHLCFCSLIKTGIFPGRRFLEQVPEIEAVKETRVLRFNHRRTICVVWKFAARVF